MTISILVSFLFLLFYITFFSRFYITWRRHREDFTLNGRNMDFPHLTVVIALKNEEKHVPGLLRSIKKQDYPPGKAEFLFVNDHSTDHTVRELKKWVQEMPYAKLIDLPGGVTGKKQALLAGVSAAGSGLIVTTDADCNHSPGWLRLIAGFYKDGNYKLISGPVRVNHNNSFLQQFQALEFASLTGTGGASFMQGVPLMCNGANLAFEKSLFLEAFSHMHPGVPSGDDIFLMLYAKKHYPGQFAFLKNRMAIVDTRPVNSWKIFFLQRSRWASKSKYYRDPGLVLLSLLVFSVSAWSVILILLGIAYPQVFLVLAAFLASKSLIDFLYLREITRFYEQGKLLRIFIPSQILYPFYILATAIAGFIGKNVNWKN